jgi:hypothetical protein
MKEDKWAKFRSKGTGNESYKKAQEGFMKESGSGGGFLVNAYKALVKKDKKEPNQANES